MATRFDHFEQVTRRAHLFTEAGDGEEGGHPFEARNIHADLPADVQALFDNGHFAQATFEAFKFVDEEVRRIAGSSLFGVKLMMTAFDGNPPAVKLNPGMTLSEKNEQDGFKLLFAGAIKGIRNPRGHAVGIVDDPDICLDHLSLASVLLRRLD